MHAERTIPEALQALTLWGEYLAENGSDNFMGAMIPIAGEDPEADYDYKAIAGFQSANDYGKSLGTILPGAASRPRVGNRRLHRRTYVQLRILSRPVI